MAKESLLLDETLAEAWFNLVNECFDAGDLDTLNGLRFRKDNPDIIAAPNVGVILWGYLTAAIDTLTDGTRTQMRARDEAFASIDAAWPLTPIPYCHAPGYWTRHIEPTPDRLRKSHKEIVDDNLESVKVRAKHLA